MLQGSVLSSLLFIIFILEALSQKFREGRSVICRLSNDISYVKKTVDGWTKEVVRKPRDDMNESKYF